MARKFSSLVLAAVLVVAVSSTETFAQEKYPSEPVRLIITHAAGGSGDLVMRVVQPYLQASLGVPVVIENMVGAGGNIARAYVFKQKPDGYILLSSKQPSMSGGEISQNGKFESLKFTHVFNVSGKNYESLAVPYDSPLKSVAEVINASRSQPLAISGPGIGTNTYVFMMLLKKHTGINFTYVPFNSGNEAAFAVAGAKTQVGAGATTNFIPLQEQKKVRILGVAGPQRDAFLPSIPTFVELGYPQVALDELVGVFAPPGLPKDRLEVLEKAFVTATSDPNYRAAAAKAQISVYPLKSKEFFQESSKMHEMIKNMADLLKTN